MPSRRIRSASALLPPVCRIAAAVWIFRLPCSAMQRRAARFRSLTERSPHPANRISRQMRFSTPKLRSSVAWPKRKLEIGYIYTPCRVPHNRPQTKRFSHRQGRQEISLFAVQKIAPAHADRNVLAQRIFNVEHHFLIYRIFISRYTPLFPAPVPAPAAAAGTTPPDRQCDGKLFILLHIQPKIILSIPFRQVLETDIKRRFSALPRI